MEGIAHHANKIKARGTKLDILVNSAGAYVSGAVIPVDGDMIAFTRTS